MAIRESINENLNIINSSLIDVSVSLNSMEKNLDGCIAQNGNNHFLCITGNVSTFFTPLFQVCAVRLMNLVINRTAILFVNTVHSPVINEFLVTFKYIYFMGYLLGSGKLEWEEQLL